MAFLESPRFPGCVSFGAVSGPMFSSVRTVTAGGHDDVIIRHEQPLHRFTFEHANRTQEDHDQLLEFFNAVKGMGHRFRVKDYTDYAATITQGVLGAIQGTLVAGTPGLGYGNAVSILQKKYTAGALSTVRNIHKPLSTPEVEIYRGGVLQILTTHYTIDYATGKVTFVYDQIRGISAHVIGADHQFTLASALSPNVTVGQRVYVTGVTGTAADVLNNLSHEVTIVSGANITVSTSTAGLTAGGGNLFMYAQASEALNWVGEFDVPCRFLSDEASFEIVNRAGSEGGLLYSWSGINLTEVRIALT